MWVALERRRLIDWEWPDYFSAMAEIDIEVVTEGIYRVIVTADGSSSTHTVTVTPDDLSRLASGASGEDLVDASFRFLLDREPKESIMSRFDLSVIKRYFPEYQGVVGDYL
jgi:hypothetical protein